MKKLKNTGSAQLWISVIVQNVDNPFWAEIEISILSKNSISQAELGTFGFFNFSNNKKWVFAFFIKLIWLGEGFLNRTGAEISY